jgi:hypothetical protein
MEIRSLAGVGWDALAWAFNAAFSDYAVAMAMTPEALANMQLRRGYVAEASFGAYEGAQLIGFVLTCRDGDRIYNSGTGVVPAHRRSGLALALLDAVTGSVEASSYVLEVLEPNTGPRDSSRPAGYSAGPTIAAATSCPRSWRTWQRSPPTPTSSRRGRTRWPRCAALPSRAW